MPISARPENVDGLPSSARRLDLALLDALHRINDRARTSAQQLVDATAVQACRRPLAVFGTALVVAAILTRLAVRPAAEP